MFDCALFDIDGVLVDIRRSYNEAIKKTVDFIVKPRGAVTDQLILKFRQSGGFNNDTDTSYAIALALLANPQKSVASARAFLSRVAENADETGIASVEKYLSKYDISEHKGMLAYPAPVKDSYIGRVFDELFYGPALFKKQNGVAPKYCKVKRPLIANDRLVVSTRTMKTLHEKFSGNLAIVSGRSRLAAEYSLKPIWKYFNLDACVFLEDEKREYAKPNPYAAKKAMQAMNAHNAIYAGDSAEDMLMARRAQEETGDPIAFVGIYGCSPEPKKSLALFNEMRAEAAAKSVNELPKLLKSVNPPD